MKTSKAHRQTLDVSVSIVLWNSRRWIKRCLESVLAQSLPVREIVVVDNGSEDGSLEEVRGFDDGRIKTVELGWNAGFAAGQNAGIRESSGSWHLILNPDMALHEECVERLVAAVNHQERVGMGTGKILRLSEQKGTTPSIIDSVGVGVGFSRAMFDIGENEPDTGQYDNDCPRSAVSGCCAMLRRTMLEEIKAGDQYFDENLFMYLEDVDMCWRAFRAGWDGLYVHRALAYHRRRGTWVPGSNAKMRVLNLRNRYVVLAKNDRIQDILKHFPAILVYEILLFLRLLLHPSAIRGYFQAIIHILRCPTRGRKGLRVWSRPSTGFFVNDLPFLLRKVLRL